LFELYFFYNTVYTIGTSLSIALVFLLIMAAIKTIQDLLRSERDRQHAILANDAKAKFLANMSHEIRTPINTVIGMNEMIIRENDNPAIAEYAGYIDSSSKMLLGLINDILDFSKIESGQYEILEGSYHLDKLLLDELNLLKARAHKKNLEIILKADPKIPSDLWGDELRIKQVITNILTNAVKYTEKGSITMSADFSWVDNDTINLSIAIKDTGAGIKKENLDKLFETFTRIEEKKNRNIEGTGLGLNIAKMLVSLMNGTIDVESTYGEGSVFTVTIPQKVLSYENIGDLRKKSVLLNKEDSTGTTTDSDTSKAPRSSPSVAAFTAPDVRILVVDDNEMNLAVIKGLLKRNLVKLDTALSGRKALELAKETTYDVILMDHMMPELDGIETLNLYELTIAVCPRIHRSSPLPLTQSQAVTICT
ncbi:MAG: response regulator, partial [Lachnospira sp.]|nr:response regulator [Lachnospira sp.]